MKSNFDLTGWKCFSERRNSASYMSPDKKWMAKFFTEATASIEDELVNEMEVTRKAISIGIKTPKVDDICELSNGKKGIIYEYIEGKRSIARAISEEPDKLDEYIKDKLSESTAVFRKILMTYEKENEDFVFGVEVDNVTKILCHYLFVLFGFLSH